MDLDVTKEAPTKHRNEIPGCPVPTFSYFLSLFLFSPILKLKPPIFPIFLASEAKFVTKLKMDL